MLFQTGESHKSHKARTGGPMVRSHTRQCCAWSLWSRRPIINGRVVTACIAMMTAVVVVPKVDARYPQDALRCQASLKEPDGLLICPEHRNGYCVKEVSDLAQEDCGRTSYFGDKWNSQTGKCEYRKCAADCVELSWDFEFEGEPYERNRFCCDFNYCNGAPTRLPRRAMPAWIAGVVALVAAQAFMGEQQTG